LVLDSNKLFSQDLNTALKYSQGERYEDADSIFKQVLKSNPSSGDVYFYYGENILKAYTADPYSNSIDNVSKDAIAIFKNGISSDSLNQLNYVGMGMVILLEKNDTLAADVYFKKAESKFPKNKKKYTEKNIITLIKLGEAQLYAKNPRYMKSVAYLEKAKEIAPKNTDVYVALGDVYVDQNNASIAVTNYNKAVYIDPKLAIPLVKIGNLYMRSRNLEEARNYFEKAKTIDSSYAPLYKGLGEMYSLSGHDNFSILNYKKFLALSGNNIPAKIQYLISLFRAKKYTEATSLVEEILNYDKSRNYLYRLAAYSSYEKKPADYQKALKYIELFFKNSPPEKVITKDYAYYGRTLLKLKDTSLVDKAFEKLMIAYKLDTTDQELVSDIATNAYSNKKYNLAIEMLNKKIKYGKSGLNDFMFLGKAYYQTSQYDKAIATFDKALGLDPENMQALTWKASTNVAIDPDSKDGLAKPIYEQIIQKGMTDTVKYIRELYDSYSYLGSFYLFIKSDLTSAEVFYQKLVNLDPKNNNWIIKGYSSLGVIYHKRKEYVKARNYYNSVLKYDAKNVNALKAVDALTRIIDEMEVKRQLGE
jgi:tetratricopeptide (TPR) repeat protein